MYQHVTTIQQHSVMMDLVSFQTDVRMYQRVITIPQHSVMMDLVSFQTDVRMHQRVTTTQQRSVMMDLVQFLMSVEIVEVRIQQGAQILERKIMTLLQIVMTDRVC